MSFLWILLAISFTISALLFVSAHAVMLIKYTKITTRHIQGNAAA